jgi:hypothetical protein
MPTYSEPDWMPPTSFDAHPADDPGYVPPAHWSPTGDDAPASIPRHTPHIMPPAAPVVDFTLSDDMNAWQTYQDEDDERHQTEVLTYKHVSVKLPNRGNLEQDERLLRRVHGMMIEKPGGDRFSIGVQTASGLRWLDFPQTTSASDILLQQLADAVGEENVQVEEKIEKRQGQRSA